MPPRPGTEADLLAALFSPAGRSDPHAILRSCALPGCQYPFVRDVLRDPGFAASSIPPAPDEAFQLLARWMIRLDGDRHRRVRDAFGGLFTARRVERYRAIIADRAAILIERADPAGSMDLVADFARPLPFTVITEVLGVLPDDRGWLAAALAALNRGLARQRDAGRTAIQAANDAAGQLLAYFTDLLDQRTATPADDLMTALAARHADGEERRDLAANCIFFINAGHQTTTTLITLGAHLLCTHPEALAALQEDPGRWPVAVEEMLRLITPATFTAATPRHDADIHGVPCAAGQPRLLFLAAANRDPSTFPDPDRFDIGRDPNPHLSFAAGAHFCLGAPLARLHGEVALSTLFTRLPRLAGRTPPDITASVPVRQVDQFLVSWPRHRPAPAAPPPHADHGDAGRGLLGGGVS
jgi:pimeloyl-[acyl-carrier protein] synthase